MDKTPFTYDYNPDYKKNALRLAKLLEQLPKSVHRQCDWGNTDGIHQCNTSGCALGLAAMYNVIPGLQYRISGYDQSISPVVNGKTRCGLSSSWETAGRFFFGDFLMGSVFWKTELSKEQIIEKLRRYAK